MQNKTICIAGKNSIAVNSLNFVFNNYKNYNFVFLPCPGDDGIDRWQPSFKKFATSLGIPQATLEDLYEEEKLIFISLEYSELIKTKKFKSTNLYNIHFSLLPKYKGMFTSAHPLLRGETESGVTLHEIDDGIDTGDIIDQVSFELSLNDTVRDLYFKYLDHSFKLFVKNIDGLLNNSYYAKRQSPLYSSYFSVSSINYSSLKINFSKTAFEIYNQFRAFNFREYQMPVFNGWQIVKTEITNEKSIEKPGCIISQNDAFFIVSSIDYDIKLFKDYYPIFWDYCEKGDFAGVKRTLKYLDDINVRNSKGWNGLIISTYNGHIDIVRELITSNADISIKNYSGTTLLMYALDYYKRSKDASIFELLLENGANYKGVDNSGRSLKDYIKLKKCNELLYILDNYS